MARKIADPAPIPVVETPAESPPQHVTGDPAAGLDIKIETGFERPDALIGWLSRLVKRQPQILYAAWLVVLVVWLLSLALAYVVWILGYPLLWQWGNHSVLNWFGAAFASIFYAGLPLWGWIGAWRVTGIVWAATLASEREAMVAVRARVRETEEDALKRLEKTDEAGLLPLLRYSRAQLDAYYVMGLEQTRRAFVNAVVAMWLGFLILLVGIGLYIGPVEYLKIARPTGDFNTIVLASAVIVEVIAALFLWVYRSTTGQLTFYYRLQMHSHTSILCYRMASSMTASDEAKRAIIDKVLSSTLVPERPPLTGSKGLTGLLTGKPD